MDILESIKIAGKTLLGNKIRSTLTMLGIIIGNSSVIAMIGIGEGTQNYVTNQVGSLGPNVLFVLPGNPNAQRRSIVPPQTLVLEDAEAIEQQVPSVEAVAPMLTVRETVSYRGNNVAISITGSTPELLTVRSLEVANGRFLNELDVKRRETVVAIGSELAKSLFGNRNPVGETLRLKSISFRVIGVMQPKGSSFGDNMDMAAYIPLSTMTNRISGNTSPYGTQVSLISISIESDDRMNAAKFQIENLLRFRHKITDEDDFTVRSQKELMDILGSITGALTLLLAAISGISLLVGGIGIMNIMLVSVTERTQEIGLRKAIGASEQDILIQFMIEAIILSVMGGLIGTGLGISGIWVISSLTALDAEVSLMAITTAVGVSGTIGLFFGVFPARQAAKLDPIVALRSA